MRNPLAARLGRFGGNEHGSATVEFVIVVPVFLALLVMSIELGFITLRHSFLERGLDIAVRDIRLGTGTSPDHDEIKDRVCENAMMITNCAENLRLEMAPADLRAFDSLDSTVDCTDKSEESKPVKQFSPGQQNQLMLLRACVKYDPMFPDAFLGSALTKDSSGQSSLVAMTAFVQEPL